MTQLPLLDFRSDTVTKPDKLMRAAMASAEVGDDILDRDPTMRELEVRVAALLGCEAALWVPSGSMGNTIALMVSLRRGDCFLAPHGAHVLDNELGAAAWLAGGMPRALDWDAGPGRMSADALRDVLDIDSVHFGLRTALLCLENTHNAAGGVVLPPDEHLQLVAVAREYRIHVHLDGARLWNAAVSLNVAPGELAAGVDSAVVCLSKGLGAPMGSVVCGSEEFIHECRRVRKMLGGGVRQGGVVAAAGLVALDNLNTLAVDHDNAGLLADGLAELGWDVRKPETNMVFCTVPSPRATVKSLERLGILAGTVAGQLRFVTHRDVAAADIKEALHRISSVN